MTTSPLWDRPPITGKNILTELSICGKINIRGSINHSRFQSSVNEAFGLDLPLNPNTLVRVDHLTCYWLGPDEWLVHCPIEKLDSIDDRTWSCQTCQNSSCSS